MPSRLLCLLLLAGCGDDASAADAGVCALTASTTAVADHGGCALLTRDTSACAASRTAQGLSGAWLRFSCRVTLTVAGTTVQVAADSQPDYRSEYFPTSNPCFATQDPMTNNPNSIVAQSLVATVPLTPTAGSSAMPLGAVGVAVNGVAIYGNVAAPGDDIFLEAATFDVCQGHPQQRGGYHYHSEPYAISDDDSALVGVLRDGSFLYGRKDADGSYPTLDADGGHTGPTPDSATDVYHYHVNEQTSTSSGTLGQKQWFLTTGTYHGVPGVCSGCL